METLTNQREKTTPEKTKGSDNDSKNDDEKDDEGKNKDETEELQKEKEELTVATNNLANAIQVSNSPFNDFLIAMIPAIAVILGILVAI